MKEFIDVSELYFITGFDKDSSSSISTNDRLSGCAFSTWHILWREGDWTEVDSNSNESPRRDIFDSTINDLGSRGQIDSPANEIIIESYF